VQRRERNVAAQVGEHGRVHAHGRKVFAAAMHHAVRHDADAAARAVLRHESPHARTDMLECRVVGCFDIQFQSL
jgi:hypothetical protein